MKTFVLVGLLAASLAHAQSNPVIPLNARLYIDADGGFDIFLTAAMEKNHVPLTITTDKSKADFALQGFSERDARSEDSASVRMVDLKTRDVVFTWSIEKKATPHSLQDAAEACAKQVRTAVVKAQQKRLGLFRSNDPALDF
jgi:hypothetical protein